MSAQTNNQNEAFFPQVLSVEELADRLDTDLKSGLTSKAAKARRRRFGRNIIRNELDLNFGNSLKSQMKGLSLLFFLVVLFVLYLFDPKTVYLVGIFTVPLIFLVGAFLETRAASELNRLSQSSSLSVSVLRDGKEVTLDSRLLVPGDVIWLTDNRIVPADCRLIGDDGRLLVLETPVSGVKTAVRKSTFDEGFEDEAVSPNMLYAGTILREGSCYAVVCRTGRDTLTRQMHRKKETFLPLLLQQVRNYSRVAAVLAAVSCFLLIAAGGLARQWDIGTLFLIASALSAASLCDSLLPMSLASFAHHLLNMSDSNLVARNQDAVSLLASVDTIMCTKERMMPPNRISLDSVIVSGRRVRLDEPPDHESSALLLLSLACSDYPAPRRVFDRATLGYLKDACIPLGELQDQWFRIDTSRDADEDVNAVLSLHADHYMAVIKGSPEYILSLCVGFAVDGKEYKMNDTAKRKLLALAESASKENAYLLAIASGITDADTLRSPRAFRRLIFRGILVFRTTVEVDIANAVFRCNSANIAAVMSTADPYFTAASIGKSTGLIRSEGEIVSGRELRVMDHGMLVMNHERYRLFLEPEPDQWLQILQLRRKNKHIVAVTGEKTEDLSLLHDADIAVVPADAPEFLRESSDFVMKENGLHVLADGVTLAKALCFRLRWVRQYLVSGFLLLFTAALVSSLFSTVPALGLPEILFGGIFANLAVAVCVALSSTDRLILSERVPPFRGTVRLQELLLPMIYGIGGGGCLLGLFLLTRNPTATMVSFLLMQFFYACGCTWPQSLFTRRKFGSRPLWILLLVLVAVFAFLLLVPPVRNGLGFAPLTWTGLAYAVGIAVVWHLAAQAIRLLFPLRGKRRGRFASPPGEEQSPEETVTHK